MKRLPNIHPGYLEEARGLIGKDPMRVEQARAEYRAVPKAGQR